MSFVSVLSASMEGCHGDTAMLFVVDACYCRLFWYAGFDKAAFKIYFALHASILFVDI